MGLKHMGSRAWVAAVSKARAGGLIDPRVKPGTVAHAALLKSIEAKAEAPAAPKKTRRKAPPKPKTAKPKAAPKPKRKPADE